MKNLIYTAALVAAIATTAAAQSPLNPGQKRCPVKDIPLPKTTVTVAYTGKTFAGKTIKVCCKDCAKQVKKSPLKYFKKVGLPTVIKTATPPK